MRIINSTLYHFFLLHSEQCLNCQSIQRKREKTVSNCMICRQCQSISPPTRTRGVTAAYESVLPFSSTLWFSHQCSEGTKCVVMNLIKDHLLLILWRIQFCRHPTAMVAGPQKLCLSCTCTLWVRPPVPMVYMDYKCAVFSSWDDTGPFASSLGMLLYNPNTCFPLLYMLWYRSGWEALL